MGNVVKRGIFRLFLSLIGGLGLIGFGKLSGAEAATVPPARLGEHWQRSWLQYIAAENQRPDHPIGRAGAILTSAGMEDQGALYFFTRKLGDSRFFRVKPGHKGLIPGEGAGSLRSDWEALAVDSSPEIVSGLEALVARVLKRGTLERSVFDGLVVEYVGWRAPSTGFLGIGKEDGFVPVYRVFIEGAERGTHPEFYASVVETVELMKKVK